MSTCPNKNTQQYKDLVKQLGSEEAAIFTWKIYNGTFPEVMDLDILKKEMDIKDSMPFSSLSSMVSSVKKYNLENNTSHSISIKKDQHSDNYIVSLIPSYVNVDNLSKLKKLLDDNNIDNDINLSRQGINDLYSKEDSMFANNVFKTDFVVPRKIEDVIQIKEESQFVEQQKDDIERRRQDTESKIKRKDLFADGGIFSNQLGGSGINSVPTYHTEINGIEFVQFSNPNTGIVDVIMTGTSDNDFVGYYRIYENGKPTEKWSSKFENQSRNKENFKTMISGVQSMLPQGHQYTEKTSISTDGLRVWAEQLNRGYELQRDANGNIITEEVSINGDAINNELGIEVDKGNFSNISVTTNEEFNSVKKALLPYLEKFGLSEKNIRWENGTVKIDLPVLKKTTIDTLNNQTASQQGQVEQLFESNPEFIQESIEKVLEQTGVKDVEDVVEFVDNISRNISNRLGITLEEYYRKNKYKYIKDPISNKEAIRLLELSSGGNLNPNDSQVTVLNQPNQDLEKSFIESPISKNLGLDINNDEHKWIFRFVTTTKIGKELLGRLGKNPNLQDLNKVIQEEFNLIKERAKSTDVYYLTELTDSYIDSQIANAKAEANSENQSMWESIKDNPKKYIEEQNKLQKSNLIGILEYYTTAHEYPLGMKMTIIDNLLNNDYSYDFRTKKYSKKVRYKNTIGLHFNPSSLFMNKVIPHALSQNAVMDDYFYEAANFKGEKLDFSKYKNNIHQVTNEGTWYYFTEDKVGDNELFHKMSALSSLHKGSWCTGGTQETADSYLERGDMYIFYSNRDNLSTVQLHVNNNKAIEIGGTLEGQGLHEEDIETVEDFQRTNPKIDLQEVRDYTRYSKILKKWNKANRDNSVLTKEEKKILFFAKKYYKDKTTNLEDFKESM